MKTGTQLIAEERQRQIEVIGRTPERDSVYKANQLIMASVAYALNAAGFTSPMPPNEWPWHENYWKPSTKIRDLVKAGALIAAEIDRLQREEEQK